MPSSRFHPIRLLLPIFLAGLFLALGLALLQNSARAFAAADPEGLPVPPSGWIPRPAFASPGINATGIAPSPDTPAFAPDHVLVKFRTAVQVKQAAGSMPQTGAPGLDRVLSQQHVLSAEKLFPSIADSQPELANIHLLRLGKKADVLATVRALQADPNVEWAEPDYLAKAASAPLFTTPDDPLFPQQWGLTQVSAPDAWDVVTGTQTVVIAISGQRRRLRPRRLCRAVVDQPGRSGRQRPGR